VPEVKLIAQLRTEFGKGAARRLRRAHLVPAVIYGHGTDPVHVTLPGHETMLALKHSNTLLSVDVEGEATLALPKDVQRDVLRGDIEHVDLLAVRRGEKVQVEIPLRLTGDAASGTLVTSELTTVNVAVEAARIPASIDYDLAGAEAGTQVHASDLLLPEGAELVTESDALVLHISGVETAVEEATVESTEVAEGAEG
jgi:large subunit ribosomal protein L25